MTVIHSLFQMEGQNTFQIFVPFQEVETTEKNALTKKIDKVKYKVSKARSELRVKVS